MSRGVPADTPMEDIAAVLYEVFDFIEVCRPMPPAAACACAGSRPTCQLRCALG